MRTRTFLILLFVVYVLWQGWREGDTLAPPRRPALGEVPEAPGPPPRRHLPVVVVQAGEKKSSTGTAFAVDARGYWMTARHVADRCYRVGILSSPRTGHRAKKVTLHTGADLGILHIGNRAPAPLPISRTPPRVGEDSFHFGYPAGRPGQVLARLIGRTRMRVRGRYRSSEPVYVWAERARTPPDLPRLNGISGGPVMNADGRVIGVHVAGSPRRGRIYSSVPASMQKVMDRAGVHQRRAQDAGPLSAANYVSRGNELRARRTVAKVYCSVRGKRRP